MRSILFAGLLVIFGFVQVAWAEPEVDQPVIPLWPEGTELIDPTIAEGIVPRHFELVDNIHHPNLTVFKPEKPNGSAVVICPGGAYVYIATGLEGYPVAEKLNEAGITAWPYRVVTILS